LRNLNVFSRVRIDTTRLDGRLALRIATADGWSTKPQIGYSSAGGDVTWMVGLVEDNLLGTATSLTAVYNKTPDRRIFDLGHVNPHFLSRRGWLQAKYSNKSDGNRVPGWWECRSTRRPRGTRSRPTARRPPSACCCSGTVCRTRCVSRRVKWSGARCG